VIHRRGLIVFVPVVAAVVLSWGACGKDSSPTTSTPMTTTVAAGPSPTPAPAAVSATCSLGNGDPDFKCNAPTSQLLGAVDAAIDQVVATHPGNFVLGEERGGVGTRQYRVRDRDAFIEGTIAVLQGQNMCVFRRPLTNTIQVKDSNDFSEEYELVDDQSYIRRGPASCTTTCTPANFPLDVGESVARIFVGIFRYRCDGNPDLPSMSSNTIPIACDALITMTPKDKYGVSVPFWLHSQNPEFWVRNGEFSVVVLGDDPTQVFNKWIYAKGVGDFSVCAAIDNRQSCINGKVIP
jgi:hypothetical protein